MDTHTDIYMYIHVGSCCMMHSKIVRLVVVM